MKRHPFDMTSFLFGMVLGGAAIGFLLADRLSWDVDGRWVLPVVLIVLGVAGVAAAVTGLRPHDTDEAQGNDALDDGNRGGAA
jgi:hypothetical protein